MANDTGIMVVPEVITDPTPSSIYAHFHTPMLHIVGTHFTVITCYIEERGGKILPELTIKFVGTHTYGSGCTADSNFITR